jgi:uncharacterized protein (DUF3820 family)
MNIEELQKWYNSFTRCDVTYKDGNNFQSRIKEKEDISPIKKKKIQFGKYKGKTLNWLYKNDNSYLLWILRETKDKKLKEDIELMIRFL